MPHEGHCRGSEGRGLKYRADAFLGGRQRLLDLAVAGSALIALLPILLLAAAAIALDSPGGVFYRCRRVGRGGREFGMFKFRKMQVGASGAPLTDVHDERFTRMGPLLAKTKLDEIPQLLNVVAGTMSLVGPRPEDPAFVALRAEEYERILRVRPGITGLSQLAFAREMEILDPQDRVRDYVERIMPAKMALDEFYAERRSIRMDLRILFWTVVAIVLRHDVAVSRQTGRLRRRVRPVESEALQMEGVGS